MTLIGKVIYYSKNVGIYHVNDYQICRVKDKWFCSCSIKYHRDPKLSCKHIEFIKRKES